MYKLEATVTFPLGAHFHQNIIDYTYKSFLKMVKRLSCVNIDGKCRDCKFCKQCQYYIMTGQSFKMYPGIIFRKNKFTKNIFRNQDEFMFEIYCIGNCDKYISYIDIFFKEYLDYTLAGYYYQLRSFDRVSIEDIVYHITSARIVSIIESQDFIESYNHMVDYYNECYGCHYDHIHTHCIIDNVRSISDKSLKRSISGYVYGLNMSFDLSKHFVEIGIGKYNYLGGGIIEIKD